MSQNRHSFRQKSSLANNPKTWSRERYQDSSETHELLNPRAESTKNLVCKNDKTNQCC